MFPTTDTMPRWQENNGGGRSPATHYRLIHWILKGGGRSVWGCEDFCVLKYPRIIISTQETANKYPREQLAQVIASPLRYQEKEI